MNTAVINIRTSQIVKNQAMEVAEQLGFSLSSLVNAYLKQLIKTKTVYHSLVEEVPNSYLQGLMKSAEQELKEGNTTTLKTPKEVDQFMDSL